MKLSEVLTQSEQPAEAAPQTVKLSQVMAQVEPTTEKTMYVPETDKVIGYPSDRNYDEIRFDVETSELKKDPGGFFGTVEVANEAAIGVFKGLGQFAAQQLPQAMAGLAEERLATMADRELPDLFQEVVSVNPLVSSKAAVDLAFRAVFGQERLEEQSEAAIRLTDRLIEKTNEIEALKTEGKAQEVGAAIGSGVASLATSLGLFALTKDATASTLLFGGMAKGSATTKARLAGKTIEERQNISTLVGVGEGLLEYAGLNLWVKWVRGSGVVASALRIGGRSVSEGAQELSQELSSETILKLSGVSKSDWGAIWKQAAYAGAIGMLVGGGVATMVSFNEAKNPNIKVLREAGLNDKEIEQVYAAIAKKAQSRVMPELEAAVTKEMMEADKGIQKAKTEKEAQKPTEAKPQKKTVTKEGLIDLYKRVMADLTAKRVEQLKATRPEEAGKRAKGDAMQQAAVVRKMQGKPTPIEVSNAIKQLDGNYMGKKVSTPNGDGVIASAPAFGRFKVKYADGSVESVLSGDIKAPAATKEQAIEKLKTEAVAEARRALDTFGNIKEADQPKDLETTVTEVEQAEPAPSTPEAEETQPQPEKGTKTAIPKAVPTTKAAQKPISTPGAKKVKSSAYQKMLERAKGDAKKLQNITDVLDALEKLEGESALYTQMNIAEQAALGIQYVEENLSSAKRITQGIEPPPPGVTRAAISIAYAQKMKEEGNVNEWIAAEKTRMLQQRRLGQEIVMERGRVDEHSPEHFISQLIDARMAMAGKKMFGQPTFKKETTIKRGEAKIQQQADALSRTLTKQELDIMEAQKIIDGIIC